MVLAQKDKFTGLNEKLNLKEIKIVEGIEL